MTTLSPEVYSWKSWLKTHIGCLPALFEMCEGRRKQLALQVLSLHCKRRQVLSRRLFPYSISPVILSMLTICKYHGYGTYCSVIGQKCCQCRSTLPSHLFHWVWTHTHTHSLVPLKIDSLLMIVHGRPHRINDTHNHTNYLIGRVQW